MRSLPFRTGAAALLVLAACSGDHRSQSEVIHDGMTATRHAVREIIPELDRQESLIGLVDELESLVAAQNRDLQDGARTLRALNADPAVSRESFERACEAITVRRRERRGRALDIHFRMIELTSDAEWKLIGKSETRAFGETLDREESGL